MRGPKNLQVRMTKSLALAITGGLGNPSKMPGCAWGIPASTCQLGGLLKKQHGTQCAECYADRGRYRFQNVQDRLWTSLELFRLYDESGRTDLWVEAMVFLIVESGEVWFRWFHSGDLQSKEMALAIFEVCRLTPKVKHWMPSRERRHINAATNECQDVPGNLTIRWSGSMVDGTPPSWARNCSVLSSGPRRHGRRCPAHMQGNACGDCRMCWDQRVTVIEYEMNNVK